MRARVLKAIFVAAALCLPAIGGPALAQGSSFGFGQPGQSRDAPVEITADRLDINRAEGTVVFEGNVRLSQDSVVLTASRLDALYEKVEGAPDRLERVIATGDVVVIDGQTVAEAERAVYTIADARVEMTGEVLVVENDVALAGDRFVIDLDSGQGQMFGRVRTVLNPERRQ